MGLKRSRRVLRYSQVWECPACGLSGAVVDHLDRGVYRFGPFDIPYPEGGRVPVNRCANCGLIYKGLVPDPADLQSLFADVASEVWTSHDYDYHSEREFVMRFIGNKSSIDVLDIGSGEGGLLAAFDGIPGRRSALDVVRNDRCAQRVSGEYILQYLEDPLRWSGQTYDVVLAFDVMEHLYRAGIALFNLALLTRPGGFLLIQTGNASYVRPPSRLRDWWYLNLFEHHMAWTPEALACAAEPWGLRLEYAQVGPHKDSNHMPAWKRVGAGALRALRHVPGADRVSLALTSYDPKLVGEPGADDHFTAVLRCDEKSDGCDQLVKFKRAELASHFSASDSCNLR